MGSGASKAKSLATDENMKKAAAVAKTATVVASAVGEAEEGEGGAAVVGALSKNMGGNNTATAAAATAGVSAVGGAIGAENAASEAKKMKDQIDAAGADGELTVAEIAQAAAKSGVLDAAVGAATGEDSNIASSLTKGAAGGLGDVNVAIPYVDVPDVAEAVEELAA